MTNKISKVAEQFGKEIKEIQERIADNKQQTQVLLNRNVEYQKELDVLVTQYSNKYIADIVHYQDLLDYKRNLNHNNDSDVLPKNDENSSQIELLNFIEDINLKEREFCLAGTIDFNTKAIKVLKIHLEVNEERLAKIRKHIGKS